MTILFKVRDKTTGKYWNGDFRRSAFGDVGKTWKKKDSIESSVNYFLRYRSRFSPVVAHSLPDTWEIVEIQLVESEVGTTDMAGFLKFLLLKTEVDKSNTYFGYFVEKMHRKGVLDQIQFLFMLKPAEGRSYVDMDRIKEARSHLRQLGVKTRTFKESNGVFGMLDRQQALKARLTLDVTDVIDLAAIRTKLGM